MDTYKNKLNSILNTVNDSNATCQDITTALKTWDEIKNDVTESIRPFVASMLGDIVQESAQ